RRWRPHAMCQIEDILVRFQDWEQDRAEISEAENTPAGADPSDWEHSDDDAVNILQDMATVLRAAKRDRDALDKIAVGLGTKPEWDAAELEWIADVVSSVRPHPGDEPDYETLFAASPGRQL